MNLTLFQKGLLLLAVPLVLLLALVGLVVFLEREIDEARRWAAHTKEVADQARRVQADLTEAQSGARGYVVTRDPAVLAPFDAAGRQWRDDLDRLTELVRDNPAQTDRARAIRAKAEAVVGWLAGVVRQVEAGDAAGAAAQVRGGDGERRMADLRAEVAAFLAVEDELDRGRTAAVDRARGRLYALLAAAGAAAVLSAAALAVTFHRGVSRRFAALLDDTRRLAAGEEPSPPLPGTDEIARVDRAFRDMAAALRRASDRVQDLYDHAPCGYHSVDPAGTVVAVNQTELRWLGYAAAEVVGRLRFADVVSPASRDTYWATFARVREHGAAADVEVELTRRDGTTFPVLLNSSAIRGPDGAFLQSRTTLTDITERKRAEETLRRSEERFRLLVEGVRDYAIFLLDPAGTVVSWNPGAERINGYAAGEIVGRHFSAFYPPEDVAAGKTGMELRVAAADGRYEEEGWRVRKDGSRYWAGVLISALRDADGKLIGFAKITRDLTERKAVEDAVRRLNAELEGRVRARTAELEEANRDLAQKNAENEMFVYSVSHDLRSPLVNLQGFSKELEKGCRRLADLLADPAVPPAVRDPAAELLGGKMEKALGFIQTAVLRLSAIIDALLRLSRAGRVEYRWEAVDVGRVVGRVVGALQGTIGDREVAVTVNDLPPARGDQTAVEQAFANLVGNALAYLAPGRPGRVEVGCLAPGAAGVPDGFRAYYVRDNGVGIAEPYRDKIFRVFQRAHPSMGSGEGIGLAIVARVAERHRGRVWVESAVGEGSTFYVTLPAPPGGPGGG